MLENKWYYTYRGRESVFDNKTLNLGTMVAYIRLWYHGCTAPRVCAFARPELAGRAKVRTAWYM